MWDYFRRIGSVFSKKRTDETLLERMRRKKRRSNYVLFSIFGSLIFVVLGLVYALRVYTSYAEDIVSRDRLLNRHFSGLVIYDKTNSIIFESDGAHELGTVTFDSIPRQVKYATLAVEDAGFYQHAGFSWSGIFRSVILNFSSSKKNAYGGSTITQQLVKNALLDDRSKSYQRKIRELILAVGVDKRYSKDQILEMYLNSNYYGRGAYGVGEASIGYFNLTIDKISVAQAAFLAGLPNAPSVYGVDIEAGKKRMNFVLSRMRDEKFITDSDYQNALNEKIEVVDRKDTVRGKYPHFSLYIRQQIIDKYGENALDLAGYRVFTTLDPVIQDLSQTAVFNQINSLTKNAVSNGAAVVMLPKTGAILAMVGSADWNNDSIDGKFNVTLSYQQPGSSFKPIIYTRALERNLITAGTLFDDSSKTFDGGYAPKNYDGKFRGRVRLRRALSNSLNLPAVEAMQKVGVKDGVDFAKKLGLKSLGDWSEYGLSLVLGGGEVTPLEMTTVYSTFANGGVYNEAYAIEKIIDKYGQPIYSHVAKPIRVVNENAVAITTNILSDNQARSEEFGATALKLPDGRIGAVKTGTTDSFRDAWTLGYTPSLAVGVWVGNNDNKPMDSVAGSLGAAPIWKEIVTGSLKNTGFETFSLPSGVYESDVCGIKDLFIRDMKTLCGNL